MLDKNDLQMIQEMMLASEQRLFGKIEESEQRMTGKIEESENRMKVMMESYFDPKFNLLYENQQIMMEQLAPRSRVDDLEDEVKFLKSVVRQMNDDIRRLFRAAFFVGFRHFNTLLPPLSTAAGRRFAREN